MTASGLDVFVVECAHRAGPAFGEALHVAGDDVEAGLYELLLDEEDRTDQRGGARRPLHPLAQHGHRRRTDGKERTDAPATSVARSAALRLSGPVAL